MESWIVILKAGRHFDHGSLDICGDRNEFPRVIAISHQPIQASNQCNRQSRRAGNSRPRRRFAVSHKMEPRAWPKEMHHLRNQLELFVASQFVDAINGRLHAGAAISRYESAKFTVVELG